MISESDGMECLKIARKAVELWVRKKKVLEPDKLEVPKIFIEPRGVFATIRSRGELRGCIGHPYPDNALIINLISAAVSSCRDPRFEPVQHDELAGIKIEVSILTKPEQIEEQKSLEEYEKLVEIGKDGLMIANGFKSGLLLPQVATEHSMDEKQFIDCLLIKAAMSREEAKNARVYKFQSQIFREDD